MTNNVLAPLPDSMLAVWLWLFPLTYLLHIAEEYYVAGGYSRYLLKLRGVQLSTTMFLGAQGFGLALMIVGIPVAQRLKFPQTLLVILGAVVLVNALTHLVTSIAHWSYGPGLFTSILIWLPLGVVTLFQFHGRMSDARFGLSVALGVGINAAVAVFTLRGGRLF